MNFKIWWRNIVKNLRRKKFYFTLDLDEEDSKWSLEDVKRLMENMSQSLPIETYEIWKSEQKNHFHVKIYLKKPLPYYQIIVARLLAYDDPDRIRFDLKRLGADRFDFTEFLAELKFLISSGGKVELVSSYTKVYP